MNVYTAGKEYPVYTREIRSGLYGLYKELHDTYVVGNYHTIHVYTFRFFNLFDYELYRFESRGHTNDRDIQARKH